jgi:hypothetical protein
MLNNQKMSKLEKIREEIGWLKVIFAIVIATDISLVAWFIQNFTKASLFLLISCFLTILIISMIIIWLHNDTYQKIEKLEEL